VDHLQREKTGKAILVVDENTHWADSLLIALAECGHAASSVRGATEALIAAEKTPWDLVVVGVNAESDGSLTLVRELGRRFDHPLVVLASICDPESVREATALGVLAYLLKPTEASRCIPTIEMALGRAQDLSELRQRVAQLASAVQQNRATSIAVGILSERLRLDRDAAFETLRKNARRRRSTVAEVDEQLVSAADALNQIDLEKPKVRRLGSSSAN
jgi:response regulator NasT